MSLLFGVIVLAAALLWAWHARRTGRGPRGGGPATPYTREAWPPLLRPSPGSSRARPRERRRSRVLNPDQPAPKSTLEAVSGAFVLGMILAYTPVVRLDRDAHSLLLVPVDFAEASRAAVDYAVSLAGTLPGRVRLLRVWNPFLGLADAAPPPDTVARPGHGWASASRATVSMTTLPTAVA